jgi:ribosomal subunit interface protein
MTTPANITFGDNVLSIVVRGRHANVSSRFREHAVEKVSKINRFAMPFRHVDVEVSHEANPRQHDRAYEVELTCNGEGPVLRAEAHASDKYTALDLAYERLQERLRRMHDKAKSVEHRRINPKHEIVESVVDQEQVTPEIGENLGGDKVDGEIVLLSGPLVVRTKQIESLAITVEQAVEAMELVGHDFYLFSNVETQKCSVLYRRRGYDFGLIELDISND